MCVRIAEAIPLRTTFTLSPVLSSAKSPPSRSTWSCLSAISRSSPASRPVPRDLGVAVVRCPDRVARLQGHQDGREHQRPHSSLDSARQRLDRVTQFGKHSRRVGDLLLGDRSQRFEFAQWRLRGLDRRRDPLAVAHQHRRLRASY